MDIFWSLNYDLGLAKLRICIYFNACAVHIFLFLFQPTNAQTHITYNKYSFK